MATARSASARAGRLAGLVLALSEDPSSTRVWERGSVGESKLAAALGKIDRNDVIFLHDRAVPHTRGNIDHIVVAPSGIYVVDAKRYRGRVDVRNVSGLFSDVIDQQLPEPEKRQATTGVPLRRPSDSSRRRVPDNGAESARVP
jgi:hypothetical protein